MATAKQTAANQRNSEHSTGPTSEAGLDASARIAAFRHGLAGNHHERFSFLHDEKSEKFDELLQLLNDEHLPTSETERILVRHMAQSEWLRARALRLQAKCVETVGGEGVQNLALFIRYQTTHERAFYRSLRELQTLRKEKRNVEIGFVSQQLKQAADARAADGITLKKDAQNLKRDEFEFKKSQVETRKEASKPVKSAPGGLEMAA